MSTILLVGVFLFADETIPLSPPLKRALYFTTITSSIITSALYPLTSLVIANYANAFLSVAYALRLVELLIINHPRQLKRLEKVHDSSSSSPVYVWKPMPPALSFARLRYVCDLLINPRSIGWAHGSKKYLPRLEKLSVNSTVKAKNGYVSRENGHHQEGNEKFICKEPTERLSFLTKEALKLVIAYLVYDTYRIFLGPRYALLCSHFHSLLTSPNLQLFGDQYLGLQLQLSPETSARLVQRFLLPPACWAACYAFVDGIRAAVALFTVGGLYLVSPTLAADPWMYPPVFGSWRYIFWPKLKDIWGKLWHDLCRRALISTSTALIPRHTPLPLRRILVGFLCFIISGVVHAAGTYTVSRDPHAVLMIISFFILLPLWIAAQEIVSGQVLGRFLPDWQITKVIIWVLDAAYVLWWGYHTAPWFFRYSMIPEALASAPLPERWSFWESP
ncbi:hypothetical protein BDW59DRAFT_151214 [Aspergillus cavernicola]|uniref:Wax synthase domain-containing protein n=1 Tax=Aspergillus cavernicola TaxID=176166 RepID=A0ABR4HWI5_9EURO